MYKYLLIIILFLTTISCEKIDGSRINKIIINNQFNQGSTATLSGQIIDLQNNSAESYGHIWSKNEFFYSNNYNSVFFNAKRGDVFQSSLYNIQLNTQYYCKSFMVSKGDSTYSPKSSFIINGASNMQITIDSITFSDPYSLKSYVTITGLNSLLAQDHGICWSTNPVITPNILLQNQVFSNGMTSGNNQYISEINNLNQNSVYSIVPYLKLNNNLIIYGDQYFANISTFQIFTSNYFITNNNAVLTGGFLNFGGFPITDYGHCWSNFNQFPEITTDNTISLGPFSNNNSAQNGLFDTSINLSSGNIYYYRSYGVNILGVQYGDVKAFTF